MGKSRPGPGGRASGVEVCSRLTAVIQLFDLLAPDQSLRAAGYWSALWRRFQYSEHPPSTRTGRSSQRSGALHLRKINKSRGSGMKLETVHVTNFRSAEDSEEFR